MAPVGRYSKTGGSCHGYTRAAPQKKNLPETLKNDLQIFCQFVVFALLERNFLCMCGSWKVIVIPKGR